MGRSFCICAQYRLPNKKVKPIVKTPVKTINETLSTLCLAFSFSPSLRASYNTNST